MTAHLKGYKTFEQQLSIVSDRGMAIKDSERCLSALQSYGYYRLSAYWYPFRERASGHQEGLDTPAENVVGVDYFDQIIDLYEFDRKIRVSLFPWLECIELSLRVAVAYELGKIDKFGLFHTAYLSSDAWSTPYRDSDATLFHSFRDKIEAKIIGSNEPIAKHHRERYNGAIPIWASTELWDFGTLENALQLMMEESREKVATQFGAPSWKMFKGWVTGFRQMRNICAHHGRLNRHHFANHPSFSKAHYETRFTHLKQVDDRIGYRLYRHLVALKVSLDTTGKGDTFSADMRTLFRGLTTMDLVNPIDYGFVAGWESQILWRPSTSTTTADPSSPSSPSTPGNPSGQSK